MTKVAKRLVRLFVTALALPVLVVQPVIAASSFHTDPPASISQSGQVVTLRKELSGYSNYGAEGFADVLYSGESDTWNFNLGAAGLSAEDIDQAEVRAALVLDDHYDREAAEYSGVIALDSNTLFSGAFTGAGVQHGAPHGEIFTNWQVVSDTTTTVPADSIWDVNITNTTPSAGDGHWIAIDWIELKLHVKATDCESLPTFSGNVNPGTMSGGGWVANITMSADDGLVAQNVSYNGTVVAEEMSLPYVRVHTFGMSEQTRRLQIGTAPANGFTTRLVQFDTIADSEGIDASATYAIELQEGLLKGCLLVTQDYSFKPLTTTTKCEPADQIQCVRFRPSVSYEYQGGGGITFLDFQAAQRLHFTPDGNKKKDTGVYRDCDGIVECALSLPHPGIIEAKDNVQPEFGSLAIINGNDGFWDNLHLTKNESIQSPGCPSCVHMHWRWGTAANPFPDFNENNNNPFVPEGSHQTVHFALVEYKNQDAERDPANYFSLIDKVPNEGKKEKRWDSVLWWGSTSGKNEDTFFYFDAFVGQEVGHHHSE